MVVQINNEQAKNYVQIFDDLHCIPVGSYGRNSHQEIYNDLDFLTFVDLNLILEAIYNYFDDVNVISHGNHYIQLVINNNQIDIWKTNKQNFWKDYTIRTIKKEKLIFINHFLKYNK